MLEMARPTSKFIMMIDTINKKAVNRICVVQSYSICSLVNCGTKLMSNYIYSYTKNIVYVFIDLTRSR